METYIHSSDPTDERDSSGNSIDVRESTTSPNATSGTAFPETTKTDSETAVERGLLLLISFFLWSVA